MSSPTNNITNPIIKGFVLPGLPHPLLCPEKNEGWQKLRNAFDQVRQEIVDSDADMLLIYSTMWPSILGHQVQANPSPEWIHVDEQFHDLGSIPYKFKIDTDFAEEYAKTCQSKGVHTRTTNYHGFPIDTGSVVALKLINPDNRIPASIVSSNIYSDRVETVVLGKSATETLRKTNKKAIAIVVSTLSNRLHSTFIDPENDKIHSLKDDEWNQRILESLSLGRLEDVAQLSRQIHREARVSKVVNFKSFWWLSAVMGQNNFYDGNVYEYQAVYGTGSAIIGLTPSTEAAMDLEFDEGDPDKYLGERNVLATAGSMQNNGLSSQTSNIDMLKEGSDDE